MRAYEPLAIGPGTGKAFFIFFGYTEEDHDLRSWALYHLGDDVAALQAAGYRVVVCERGDRSGLDQALRSAHPASAGARTVAVLWDGHGAPDGTLCTSDGKWVIPEELSPELAHDDELVLFIMTTCHTGKFIDRWKKRLGPRAKVLAWGGVLLVERIVNFFMPDAESTNDLDDLLRKHLGVTAVMPDAPLIDLLAELDPPVPNPTLEGAVKEATWRLNSFSRKANDAEVYSMHVRVAHNEDPAAYMPYISVIMNEPFRGSVAVRAQVKATRPFALKDLPSGGFQLQELYDAVQISAYPTRAQLTGKELALLLQKLADHAAKIRKMIGLR